MQIPDDMYPLAKDGEIILYATEDMTEGMVYDSIRGEIGDRQLLQVFFKWGNFVELTEQEKAELVNA